MAASTNSLNTLRSKSRWRAIWFRAFAVSLGLLPFVVIEVVLRVCGVGNPNFQDDPFVGFSEVRPLFQLSAAGDRYEIAPSRLEYFYPESFPARKAADEFRIFCIGDSTVVGNPWTSETSFTTWLEICLNVADRSRRWEVVNCGGISYASYRMVPILQEVLSYQPDLIILHCSHNEFLEERTYHEFRKTPRWLRRLHEQVSRLRLYNVLRSWIRPRAVAGSLATSDASRSRPNLSAEVEALLDYRGGLERYQRDDAWRQGVIAHFEFNLRRMVALAKQARVPLILLNPACNLRDSPPFKAEHRPGLSVADQQRWEGLWDEARQHYRARPRPALSLLQQALAIDDQHASLRYDLAKCLDSLGQFTAARAEYVQARELDICPLRILEPMSDLIADIGRDTQTPVVDLRELFDRLSRDGIPGSDWFIDHVHPTIPGYQRVGERLAQELIRLGFVRTAPGWEDRAKVRCAAHLASLPPLYFIQGQRRLEALMRWAHGRGTKIRGTTLAP